MGERSGGSAAPVRRNQRLLLLRRRCWLFYRCSTTRGRCRRAHQPFEAFGVPLTPRAWPHTPGHTACGGLLSSHGLFLPEPSWTNRSMLWASGVLEPGERVRVRTDEVRAHMRGLEARDAYARCKLSAKRAARKGGTGCAALEAAAAAASSSRPCVVASSTRSAHSAAKALGTVRCAAASSSAYAEGMSVSA